MANNKHLLFSPWSSKQIFKVLSNAYLSHIDCNPSILLFRFYLYLLCESSRIFRLWTLRLILECCFCGYRLASSVLERRNVGRYTCYLLVHRTSPGKGDSDFLGSSLLYWNLLLTIFMSFLSKLSNKIF